MKPPESAEVSVQDQTPVIVVAGPTAAGKTATALAACRARGDLEIVSADSRQIFRRMDIGTAKPDPAALEQIPHHCIDIRDPDAAFSAGEFGRVALQACRDIRQRGRIPLVVGGSGLYIRALTDGLFPGGRRSRETKRHLEDRAEREGLRALHDELGRADPAAAGRIHPNDRQRIIRALEVWTTRGKTLSELQKDGRGGRVVAAVFLGLRRPRKQLYDMINARVDEMLDAGLVREVEDLRRRGYGPELQSQKTVGYREIHQLLDGGLDLPAARALIMQSTRRFAKRQMTWFAGDRRYRWFDLDGDGADRAVRQIIACADDLRRHGGG